jgi:hypothetical protein
MRPGGRGDSVVRSSLPDGEVTHRSRGTDNSSTVAFAGSTRAMTIVNRETVVAITVPAASNCLHDDELVDLPVFWVAVDAGGRRFEGDIVVDMPPGHQRVADWLNAPPPFLTVRNGLTHHLIHKPHVLRVLELERMSA